MNSLIIVYSYHHKNTLKIAQALADILAAEVKSPDQVDPQSVPNYDLIGFGSGIYGESHHKSMLALADNVPIVQDRPVFIFSTAALTGQEKAHKDHATIREKLQSKGYRILDEFQCKGFNTNSFMRFFGGMNKGRPNAEDLQKATNFAQDLIQKLEQTRQ